MGRQLLGSPPPALDFVVPASRLWRLRLAHALARDKRRLPLLCIPRPCAFASWAPRPSKCERPHPSFCHAPMALPPGSARSTHGSRGPCLCVLKRPPPARATPLWIYLQNPRTPCAGRAGLVCVCVCVSRLPPNSCHAPMNLPPKPTHSVRGPRGLLCPLGLVQYILIGLVHFHTLHALVQIFSSGTVIIFLAFSQ